MPARTITRLFLYGILREAAVSLWYHARTLGLIIAWASGRPLSAAARLPLVGTLVRARQAKLAGRRSTDYTCPCPRCGNTLRPAQTP